MQYTKSGYWRVYHREEAKNPEAHPGGPWFFGPSNSPMERPFSEGFPTEAEALQEAELTEAEIDDINYLMSQAET